MSSIFTIILDVIVIIILIGIVIFIVLINVCVVVFKFLLVTDPQSFLETLY